MKPVEDPTLVVLESPFAGHVALNLIYARACMADCFDRGEAPYASHTLYTQAGVLNDAIPAERRKGMQAGFAWGALASMRVVYTDLGMSSGMHEGVAEAKKLGQTVEYRTLGGKWTDDGADDS